MKLTSQRLFGASVLTGFAVLVPTALHAQSVVGTNSTTTTETPVSSTGLAETAAPPTTSTQAPTETAPPSATGSSPSPTVAPESLPPASQALPTEPLPPPVGIEASLGAGPVTTTETSASPAPTDATPTSPPPAQPSGTVDPSPVSTATTEAPAANSVAVGTGLDVGAATAPARPQATVPSTQKTTEASRPSGNLGAQFDLRPYSRPVVSGFGYSGFVQAQYVNSQLSEDQLQQGNVPLNRDQFALRSARLRIEQGYDFTAFGLELDATTTRSPMLSVRRAEATVFYRGDNPGNVTPLIALSAGVIDLPFGFELAESIRTRPFMERSVISSALFPTQNDVGLRLFGAWRFARYAFALVNGEPFAGNDWPSDPNARKDIVGRLGAEGDVTDSVGLSGGASFAFGKGFHAGRPAVKDSLFWRDDNEDGMAQATEVVGVPGSSASPSSNFERFALGVDLELQFITPLGSSRLYGEAYVASNHDRALFVSDPVTSGVDVRQLGGYVALSQDLSRYAFVGVRADLYDPNTDFFESRRGEFVPETQTIVTWSPIVGVAIPRRARLIAQYDIVKDYFARNKQGVPTDAKNNQLTVRLQVEL